MTSWKSVSGLALFGLLAALPAEGQLIDVQFTEDGSPAYSGAAALGQPGDVWNTLSLPDNASGASASNIPLQFASGAASGVTLSYSTPDGAYDASGNGAVFQGSPYQNLMDAYLYADNFGVDGPGSVSLYNLTPSTPYQLILYSAANAPGRVTNFTVNGQSQSVTTGSDPVLAQGSSYDLFDVDTDASGQILITLSAGNADEADLNGLQLQPVSTPEPASLGFAAGVVGLMLRRIRR